MKLFRLPTSIEKVLYPTVESDTLHEFPTFADYAILCAIAPLLLGLTATIGWIVNIPILLRGHPGSNAMSPAVAMYFIVMASCFVRYFRAPRLTSVHRLFFMCGVFWVFWVFFYLLSQSSVNQLVFNAQNAFLSRLLDPIAVMLHPVTALIMIFTGFTASLWPYILTRSTPLRTLVSFIASMVFIILLLSILSYVSREPIPIFPFVNPIPFVSSIGHAFIMACIIVSMGTDVWPLKPFRGQSTYARLLRTFIPLSCLSIITYVAFSQYVFASLNPAISSILTILLTTFIIIAMVSRASRVVGMEISQASQDLTHQLIELVDNLKVHSMYMLSPEGHVLTWTAGATRLKGFSAEEVIGKDYSMFFTPEDVALGIPKAMLQKALDSGVVTTEGWRVRKDGSRFWAEIALSVIRDHLGKSKGYAMFVRDVTERWKHKQLIEESLMEKELLLKEIHHRVKNNLQVVNSLLRMQARKIKDVQMLEFFKESQSRVESMALIHEHLYQSKNLSSIDFDKYISSIVSGLLRSYSVSPDLIECRIDAKDIYLPIDIAIPCGLIVTELITNTMKHAFPRKKKGLVEVTCKVLPSLALRLVVRDNGIGLPEGFKLENTHSLGLMLVKSLARQISAQFLYSSSYGHGTEFSLEFYHTHHSEVRV